jgi:signal transduction histidine kinase
MGRAWLPALCALLQVLAVGTGGTGSPTVPVGVAFTVLGLAAGASLGWRDRFPVQVFVFCAVAYPVQALLLAPPLPAALAVMCYQLVRHPHTQDSDSTRRTRTVAAALVAAVLLGMAGVAGTGQAPLVAPFGLVVVTAAAFGLLLASHDAREESRRRDLLAEQRLRIARDLHDVVGHSVGAISVQAGAARMALAAGVPHDAATAVVDIETASRDLLREVRWLVGLLREDAQLPGLADVDGLLDSARRSGLDVRVMRSGSSDGLRPEVGNAAYRILQEALTNVVRHGGSQRVEVTIGVTNAVLVRVCNPCADEVVQHPGHGLVGMRERAAQVGGTVHSGPVPGVAGGGGAWVVEAHLPLGASR